MSLKVDLKTQEPRKRLPFKFSLNMGWTLVAGAIFLSFIIFYLFDMKLQGSVNARQAELQSWQDKVESLSSVKTQIQDIKREIDSVQARINQIRELHYDPLRYSILLTRISQLLPDNLWLKTLTIAPNQSLVTLSGSALATLERPPLASVADFMSNLQNDPRRYFSDVVLQGTTSTGKEENIWDFTMQINYMVPLITASAAPPPSSTAPGVPSQPPPSESGKEAQPLKKGSL